MATEPDLPDQGDDRPEENPLAQFLAQFGITPGPDGEFDLAALTGRLQSVMSQFQTQMAGFGPSDASSGMNWTFTKDIARRVTASLTMSPVEAGPRRFHTAFLRDFTDVRLQRERMQGGLLPSEGEFYKLYGLTEQRLKLAKPDALVMHPGPINRGVEIESAVADGPQSVILNQVTYGIAIRMAVLSMAMSGQAAQRQLNAEEQN